MTEIKVTCSSDKYLPLDELVPFEDNPRELSESGFRKLKKSILEMGLFKPFLVWKKGNRVLGGNQRLRVLKSLVEDEGFKVEKLPVTVLDLDEKTAKIIVLRDNQSDGDWAYEMLSDYLRNLEKLGADIALTGFTDTEYEDLKKLSESTEELRERLGKLGDGEDLEESVNQAFGFTFKVPEEDKEMYDRVMMMAQDASHSSDLWPNLKYIFGVYLEASSQWGNK